MTWKKYIKLLFRNQKTADRYTKLGNTLLRKTPKQREEHIGKLSRSSQIVYRTALKHVQQYEQLFRTPTDIELDIWASIDADTKNILEQNKPIKFSSENLDETLEDLRKQQKARFFYVGEELVMIPDSIVAKAKKQDKTYLYK